MYPAISFHILTFSSFSLNLLYFWIFYCCQLSDASTFKCAQSVIVRFPTSLKVPLLLPLQVAFLLTKAHRVPLSLSNRVPLWFSTIAVWDHTEVLLAERSYLEERYWTWVAALGTHHLFVHDTVTAWHCHNQLESEWVFHYLVAGKTFSIFWVVAVKGCWWFGISSALLCWYTPAARRLQH